MGYKFAQVRYNQPNSSMNTSGANHNGMVTGSTFQNYNSIVQLGIQAPPGTKFYLNNSGKALIVGFSGIFQLDLRNTGTIDSIRFDGVSLNFVESNPSAYIIVDMLYGGGEN